LLFLVIFISINILFVQKEPVYDDLNLKKLLNFIEMKTDTNSIIQTDFEVYNKYVWISPLIRSISRRAIFIDNSYTFNLEDSKEWLIRKGIIKKIKADIKLNKIEKAFCDLKKYNIDYFISSKSIESTFAVNLLVFKNSKFYVYKIKDHKNKSC